MRILKPLKKYLCESSAPLREILLHKTLREIFAAHVFAGGSVGLGLADGSFSAVDCLGDYLEADIGEIGVLGGVALACYGKPFGDRRTDDVLVCRRSYGVHRGIVVVRGHAEGERQCAVGSQGRVVAVDGHCHEILGEFGFQIIESGGDASQYLVGAFVVVICLHICYLFVVGAVMTAFPGEVRFVLDVVDYFCEIESDVYCLHII